jgi:aspartyl/asparaginyl beta-hydroxylase (cupin superfamily)
MHLGKRMRLIDATRMAAWMETRIAKTSDGSRTFFAPETFPWVETIEANCPAIRKEVDDLLKRKQEIPNLEDISPEQGAIARGANWKSFFLYGFGHKIESNCEQCPQTARIVTKIEGLKMAMFSILAPKSHIPPHRGPYKGLLRYHMGLIIPSPSATCRIRVGDEIRSWQEGKSLVFDDSYDHEAWNDSDFDRVILFVDFLRPLPFRLALMNRLTIRQISKLPFVTDAVERLRVNQDHQVSQQSDVQKQGLKAF